MALPYAPTLYPAELVVYLARCFSNAKHWWKSFSCPTIRKSSLLRRTFHHHLGVSQLGTSATTLNLW